MMEKIANHEKYLIKCLHGEIGICSYCYREVGKVNRKFVQQVCQINSPNAANNMSDIRDY